MIDVNDNAKAAVREFADYIGQSDKCERYLEYVTTKKTVADAVEAFSHEDLAGEWQQIRYAPKQDYFFTDINRDEWFDSVHVCTRAEFEAYVKEQESKQEDEKWTHTYHGDNCKIVHQEKWQAWIVSENGLSKLVPISELRKTKPAMTKEQHAFLCKFSADSNNLEVIAEVESYLAKHDII